MEGSRGLSEPERQDLLARIDRLLGGTPKGELVRELVEELPGDDRPPFERPGAEPTTAPEDD
jgi:hypothetical protein